MVLLSSDMNPRSLRFSLPILLLTMTSLCAHAQTAQPASSDAVVPATGYVDVDGVKVREIHPRNFVSPIPIDAPTSSLQTLEFRTAEQMTAADRALADASQAEIARRAGLQGLGFSGSGAGNWNYEQAVCPVFPDHLVLEYSRQNGQGDVSLFSAVVPKGAGHVRVIPVRRRGNSLFTPVGANALTVNDFNHIVQEENHGLSQDWLTLGLCYAALAGGHVNAATRAATPEVELFPLLAPPRLSVSYQKPGAVVYFADFNPQNASRDWVLTFAGDGRLLKVKHGPAPQLQFRSVPGQVMEEHGVPVNGNIVELPAPKPGN
jgi:hypothetical protein